MTALINQGRCPETRILNSTHGPLSPQLAAPGPGRLLRAQRQRLASLGYQALPGT